MSCHVARCLPNSYSSCPLLIWARILTLVSNVSRLTTVMIMMMPWTIVVTVILLRVRIMWMMFMIRLMIMIKRIMIMMHQRCCHHPGKIA